MRSSFLQFASSQYLFTPNDRILLAISGGVDSMVLLDLFCQITQIKNTNTNTPYSELTIAIAHCNFNLRGEASDKDQALVKKVAAKKNITLHTKSFDTVAYAKKHKLSIEMAARELRYKWFEKLSEKYTYTLTATAHHKNDQAETFLINFTRGTGLRGLISLKPKTKKIIRPLLFATRKEIEEYAHKNAIEYRTDHTNNEEQYTRNKIRHSVVPVLQEINPSFIDKTSNTIDILRETYALYFQKVTEIKKDIISSFDIETLIAKNKLYALEQKKTILYEIISEYGFNEAQVKQALQWEFEEAGACIFSKTHELYNGRNYLHIADIEHEPVKKTYSSLNELLECSYWKEIAVIDISDSFSITKEPNTGLFDIDKIQFPITVRNWQKGDKMHPFGMKGSKKISDLLTDQKLSHKEKQQAKVMLSGNSIMWLIGIRSSEKYKISDKTKKALQICI